MGEEQRRAEGTHLYDLPWLLLVDDDSLGPLLDIDVSRASADPTEWCPALWWWTALPTAGCRTASTHDWSGCKAAREGAIGASW